VRFLDETRAEIKRMWVAPSARTSGVGGRLVEYLEDLARGSGRGTMVLDTNSALREAVALYERHGYKRTRPYNDNPDADLWFEKKLTEAKAASGPGGHRRDLHVDARD
jgi:ribosomal protein S18 acetylase RimI-like enzyme